MSFRVTTSDVTKTGTVGNGGSARVEKSGPFESAARRVVGGMGDRAPVYTASFAASSAVEANKAATISRF